MSNEGLHITINVDSEAETQSLAARLAALCRAGDLIGLHGDLGAGKTAFARGFIQALCGRDMQVPSPSFTLVQPYEADGIEIIHADFYRLGDASEVEALGLLDTLAEAITLVEWPERGDGVLPQTDFDIYLHTAGELTARRIEIIANGDATRLTALQNDRRAGDIAAFLEQAGWETAQRRALAGDASTRRFERLTGNGHSAILMDWQKAPDGPPIYDGKSYSQMVHLAEAAPAYCRISRHLADIGLGVPEIIAADEAQGFVLLEDLGDMSLDRLPPENRAPVYFEAVETLLHLHNQDAPDFLPLYDGSVQAIEAALFCDWYLPYIGHHPDAKARGAFMDIWQALGETLISAARPVLVLRDFHSVNLMWREERQARYRLGLIDVQDALAGHPAYDLMSLLQDARIDVTPEQAASSLRHYTRRRFGSDADTADSAAFETACAIAATQRNLKIAGIFVRLAQRDAKPGYLAHLPRILTYLQQGLTNPALAEMSDWLHRHAAGAQTLNPNTDVTGD